MNIPETRYADNGGLAVGYQIAGDAGPDLLYVPNWLWNVDACWLIPEVARWLEYLGSFGRLIMFDQPGTGVSDPISLADPPTLEQWVDSARVVMDAAGSERAHLLSLDGAFAPAALFAATFPARAASLTTFDGWARFLRAEDYPIGAPASVVEAFLEHNRVNWGTGTGQHTINPDVPWNDEIRKAWGRAERLIASPRMATHMFRLTLQLDVRHILPSVACPTLVIHHEGGQWIRADQGRYITEHIPNARQFTVPGRNSYPFFDDWREITDEVREFVTGSRGEPAGEDRMLATVLFTDIVSSTEHAARIGDSGWRALLDAHDAVVRSQLARFRGREVKTVGDGFLATFDGPQRAIKCATAVREAVKPLGIEVRSGLHTGECEIRGEDVGGIAVHIGARVAAQARPSEVLVSSTVKDLVVGSGIAFEDRGTRELKGVPGEWRVYAVAL